MLTAIDRHNWSQRIKDRLVTDLPYEFVAEPPDINVRIMLQWLAEAEMDFLIFCTDRWVEITAERQAAMDRRRLREVAV
jgi:hypothetical protein